MAAITAYLGKNVLDWICGGAAATQPANRWAALAWGTPNSTGASELNTSIGYSRLTALFGAAASPAGSASITAAQTYGPFSSNQSILGINLFDGSPVGSSNQLLYGTLQTARTVAPGDSLVIAAGALTITIA